MKAVYNQIQYAKTRFAALIFILFFHVTGHAAEVTLLWDANPENNLAGYKLYYNTSSGAPYSGSGASEGSSPIQIPLQSLSDSENPQFTVTGLEDNRTYYFCVTAYDNETPPLESDYSNEVNSVYNNLPPVSDAGPDQTVAEGVTVTLNGTNSSDPDGNIVSYAWTQTAVATVSLSNPSDASPTFTAPEVGPGGTALTFSLTVTDQEGLQAADEVIVNITFDNTPPVADAGPDQTVAESDPVTLNGANSSDPDNNIVSYAWAQTAGTTVSLSNPSDVSPAFTAPEVGPGGTALTFTLTVTDQEGLQASDEVIINITFDNIPPVADAGPDQTVNENEPATLNGANSSDPDNNIVSYAWAQTAGTTVTLSNPSDASPAFTAPEVGSGGAALAFTLTVTDQEGLQASDEVIVNITFDNTPPVADAGPDQTISESDPVTLNGSNSSDPDNNIVSYAWTQTAGTAVSLSNPSDVSPAFTAPEVGSGGAALAFTLTVTDQEGGQASDEIIINITFDNTPPVADAGLDQTADENEVIILNGSNSSDPDNNIVSYEWVQASGSVVSLSNPSSAQAEFTAPSVDTGGEAFSFTLTVTDQGGLQSSDAVIVNITFDNNPPFSDAGPNQTVTTGATVTLTGTDSADADNGIADYLWSQTSGPAVSLSDSAAVQPEFTAPEVSTGEASLAFMLTVTDNDGLQATDTVIITVLPAGGEDTTTIDPDAMENLSSQLLFHPSIEIFDTSYSHVGWAAIRWTENNRTDSDARLASGDIDGDGKDEIIIGIGTDRDPSIPGGVFQVLDHDLSPLTWGQVEWPDYNEANGEVYPACGDMDGDGKDEIILGLGSGGQGRIEVFGYTSGTLHHKEWLEVDWDEYNEAIGTTRPACGDIDGDNNEELLIGLETGDVSAMGMFQLIDDNYTHLQWGEIDWPDYNTTNGESFPACGDTDGDGISEIFIGLGIAGEGQVEILDFQADSVIHRDWITVDWEDYNQTVGTTRPVCGDTDGDQKDEIIIGLASDPTMPDIPGGRFQVIDDDYTHLEWTEIAWPDYNTANGESFPASADINGDGLFEIITGLGYRFLDKDLLDSDAEQGPELVDSSSSGAGCFIETFFILLNSGTK